MGGIATHFGKRKSPYYQNREQLGNQAQAAQFDPDVNHLGQRRVGRRVMATQPQAKTVAGQDFGYGFVPKWDEAVAAQRKRRQSKPQIQE